jgi:hypothetical protein
MKKILGVILVLLLTISFLAACGTGIKLAEFTLSSVIVSPSTATVNSTVVISAIVTNVGEVSDDCDVSLTIDGYTDGKSISSLAGGESNAVSFAYAATTVGNYTATVSTADDTESKSFTVKIGDGGEDRDYIGDSWVYTCSYENPDGKTKQDTNKLNVTLVAEVVIEGEDSHQFSAVFVPQATRDAADMPLTLHIGTADIWNSKKYMEYLKQSSAIVELPGMPSTITWAYAGEYGWPYETGKTWSATVHTVAGPLDLVVERESKVLGVETITVPAGTFDCWHIVTYDPASPDTYTYERWLNTTDVKSDVKMIDRDTWAGEETRVLTSYYVS